MDAKLYFLWKEKQKVLKDFNDEHITGETRDDKIWDISDKISKRLDELFMQED